MVSILLLAFGLICLAGLAALVAGIVMMLLSKRESGVSDARQGWISEGSDRRD